MDDHFYQNFTGSASANVVTMLIVGVLMILKRCVERNKHSECHSCCISFEIDNKTVRDNESPTDSIEDDKSVYELHPRNNISVREEPV